MNPYRLKMFQVIFGQIEPKKNIFFLPMLHFVLTPGVREVIFSYKNLEVKKK